MKILTNFVNIEGQVWASKSKILKSTNNASILGIVLRAEWGTFMKGDWLGWR
jgi:hypothetical protein